MNRFFKLLFRITLVLTLLVVLAGAGLYLVFSQGPVSNEQLRAQVEQQLSSLLGPQFEARMEESSLAIGSGGILSLAASGVTILRDGSLNMGVADNVRVRIKAAPLLTGSIIAEEVVVEKAKIAVPPMLPEFAGLGGNNEFVLGWAEKLDIGAVMSEAGRFIGNLAASIDSAGLDSVRFREMQLIGFDQLGLRMRRARLESLVFERRKNFNKGLFVTGRLVSDKNTLSLTGSWRPGKQEARILELALTGLDMQDVLLSPEVASSGYLQMDSPLTIKLRAPYDETLKPKTANLTISVGVGNFVLGDEIRTTLSKADISLALMPDKNQIELQPSPVRFEKTKATLSGGLRFASGAGAPPLFELLANDVTAFSMVDQKESAPGALKISGSIDAEARKVFARTLLLKTPSGEMAGDAEIDFMADRAHLRLDLAVTTMDVAHFKQFWPAIIAPGAHNWAQNGIRDGKVRNAILAMRLPVEDLWNDKRLTPDNLSALIPVEGATVKTTGSLPPISNAMGQVGINGPITSIQLSAGELDPGAGGKIAVDTGSLVLQTGEKGTLPADLALKLSGPAAAIAKLGTLEPLNFSKRLGLKPADLSGSITAGVTTSFDVLRDFTPDQNQWAASVQITDGASKTAFAGRKISGADLIIEASPAVASIKGSAEIDGLNATLDIREPLKQGSASQRTITLSMDEAARKRLGIDTDGIVGGTVGVTISSGGNEAPLIEADLTSATLSFPWIGWTKGKGIKGSAKFILQQSGKVTRLADLSLQGKGFSARGTVSMDKAGLVEAVMKKVRLNRTDDFDVSAKRSRKGYDVAINARSYDGRALIRKFLDNERAGAGGKTTVSVSGGVSKLIGFNNSVLNGVSLDFVQTGSRVERAIVKALAAGDAATSFSLKPVKGGMQTNIYSENAGAVLSFLDLYSKARGGALRAKLVRDKSQIYRGTVQADNFTLLEEPRLAALLQPPSPTPSQDRLRDEIRRLPAFRNNSAKVEHLRAAIEKGPGFLKITKGQMQGGDASAAFQGTVYDKRNRIDIRGTFLPARGLNKLVSAIPLIGLAFGSGKTTGFLGITFRLRGSYGNPRITVNPLSIIAPGVFRKLFQF